MLPFFNRFALVLLFLAFSGCTTLSSMEKVPEKGGVVQNYDASYKDTFDLALYTTQAMSFDIESQDAGKRFIVAENGMSGASYGERIGIYLRELGPQQTEVRVVCKAKLKTNVFAPKWSNEFHATMQQRLTQLKQAGKIQ